MVRKNIFGCMPPAHYSFPGKILKHFVIKNMKVEYKVVDRDDIKDNEIGHLSTFEDGTFRYELPKNDTSHTLILDYKSNKDRTQAFVQLDLKPSPLSKEDGSFAKAPQEVIFDMLRECYWIISAWFAFWANEKGAYLEYLRQTASDPVSYEFLLNSTLDTQYGFDLQKSTLREFLKFINKRENDLT